MINDDYEPGRIVAMLSDNGWHVGVTFQLQSGTYVQLINGREPIFGVMLDLGMNFWQSTNQPQKLITKINHVAINNETAEYIKNVLKMKGATVGQYDGTYQLHIYEYDGRKHHMYDLSLAI